MDKKHAVEKIPRKAIAIAATGTSFTTTITYKGVLTRYLLECFDATNAVTRTLTLVDENSITIFTGAAHADNGNYSVPIDVEIDGTYTVTITLSGAAGGSGGTDYITFWLRGM